MTTATVTTATVTTAAVTATADCRATTTATTANSRVAAAATATADYGAATAPSHTTTMNSAAATTNVTTAPSMPTVAAAPSESRTEGVTAPVKARSVPAIVVPAIIPAAEEELSSLYVVQCARGIQSVDGQSLCWACEQRPAQRDRYRCRVNPVAHGDSPVVSRRAMNEEIRHRPEEKIPPASQSLSAKMVPLPIRARLPKSARRPGSEAMSALGGGGAEKPPRYLAAVFSVHAHETGR
jgi:hypothetical protein